jgi:sulfide:quinone oxidoreductase
MSSPTGSGPLSRVLIAGGGVGALEAALALHELAQDRVSIALLAPEPEFVYRPMRVGEPFAYPPARRYRLEEIARDLGAGLFGDSFKSLDTRHRVVTTQGGRELEYDALLIAVGARLRVPFDHAVTIDDATIDAQLHGLIQDIEQGYTRSIAFVIPAPMAWPLPAYELALMTAHRAYDMNQEVAVTVVTPEEAPLAVFGSAVSEGVAELLETNRIQTITSAYSELPEPGQLSILPGARHLRVDRVVALPQLVGPSTPGVPGEPMRGFIPIDEYCRVTHLERVYAAGDATNFPVKFGGIAAQQADTAAQAIAALAGAPVEPEPFRPLLRGILSGAEKPLYLSAHLTGGHGSDSTISEQPTWSPATKIAARYLAAYLAQHDQPAERVA